MRLLMLESIWSVRCRSNGKPYASRQVISRFLAALQQQLKHDWARTQGDIRINSGAVIPAGCLTSHQAVHRAALSAPCCMSLQHSHWQPGAGSFKQMAVSGAFFVFRMDELH